jgi:hypothetical protein
MSYFAFARPEAAILVSAKSRHINASTCLGGPSRRKGPQTHSHRSMTGARVPRLAATGGQRANSAFVSAPQ